MQAKEVTEGQLKCLQHELEAERALRRQEQEDTAQQLLQAEQQCHESLRLQGAAQQLQIKELMQDLASERERHRAEMQGILEEWEREKAEREQEHKKVLLEMRQKVATLQAQQEEEQSRFENAKQKILLGEQEKRALSEALLQTQGELSQARQQVQQLRQEVKEQQEKGQTIKAELQGELQEAWSEIQAAQRRHKEEQEGIKEEMNLLLEQREALQKQVGELTSQLAASRESQEGTVQRAQQEVNEAQEESRQKLLEVEHVQKMLEEAEHQNKELQVHLQNLERERSHWEEAAQQNSELQASVNAVESEKARLILSLEEKDLRLRTLEEENLVLNSRMSQLRSTLQQAQQISSTRAGQLQELNTQIWAQLDAVRQKAAREAAEEKQVLETEVSELRVRLQSSEERAEAVAMQLMKRAEHEKTSGELALEQEAVTLHQKMASLQRKLESLERKRKDVQAVGAEGKQVSEHSREGVECVQDLVATSAEVKTEKRESTTEPRRTGELVSLLQSQAAQNQQDHLESCAGSSILAVEALVRFQSNSSWGSLSPGRERIGGMARFPLKNPRRCLIHLLIVSVFLISLTLGGMGIYLWTFTDSFST
ncbi:centrosome-associated protein CEP250-like [Hirundo rustica]|uniref:centrosome-associated protein CEP250-like n=1 Tax=Hirundo rustica TaxID=43150 RepID=UPI002673ECE8|nr:centrosome-associated protein CEP250-like [Hirundo rustica]